MVFTKNKRPQTSPCWLPYIHLPSTAEFSRYYGHVPCIEECSRCRSSSSGTRLRRLPSVGQSPRVTMLLCADVHNAAYVLQQLSSQTCCGAGLLLAGAAPISPEVNVGCLNSNGMP